MQGSTAAQSASPLAGTKARLTPELLSLPASIVFADQELVLRRLQADDADAIVGFARSLPSDDLLFLRRDITDRAEVEAWIAEAMAGNAPTILALTGQELIGYVLLAAERVRWARHIGEVRLMVAPVWRGRGLGGLLLSQAVALGRAAGYQKLIAQMTRDQDSAAAAFTRFGFEHEATLPERVIDHDGQLRSLRVMGLRVDAFQAPESGLVEAAQTGHERTLRWRGPAELLDANGIVVAEVDASLWKLLLEGRGPRWGGDLIATAAAGPQWSPGDPPPELRLLDGGTGVIRSIGTVRMDLSGTNAVHVAQLSGQGQAPF